MNSQSSGPRPAEDENKGHQPSLWMRLVPLGYGIGLTSFATIAAPLLAGFSLTTIVALSGSADDRGTRGDIAIAAFSVTTTLMLFAMQAGIAASERDIPPDQRAAQFPEARHRLRWMEKLRADQWRDQALAFRLYARCRWTYNLGIISFLGGLIALLIPAPGKWGDPHTGLIFRIAALAVTAIALLIEIVLTFHRPPAVSRWLVPGSELPPTKLKEVTEDPDVISDEDAQRLAFAEYGSFGGGSEDGNAAAFAAVTSALHSLAAQLDDLNQTVERSIGATVCQTETAQAQLALAREDSDRTLLAAAAMRRANIKVTGPYKAKPPADGEERWRVLNCGPAVARGLRMELPRTTAPWLRQDAYLLGRPTGPRPDELGDLDVGREIEVRVSKVGKENYPVSVVLRWTDDDGPQQEHRFIGTEPDVSRGS
jgi:hypothetical protein